MLHDFSAGATSQADLDDGQPFDSRPPMNPRPIGEILAEVLAVHRLQPPNEPLTSRHASRRGAAPRSRLATQGPV